MSTPTVTPHAPDAVTAIAQATGINVELNGRTLTVDGVEVPLPNRGGTKEPLAGSYADLLGIKGLLPTVPQGDDRDRLLWRFVSEARPEHHSTGAALLLDTNLEASLSTRLPFPNSDAGAAVAEAIKDRFFSAKDVKNLKPMHSSLPMNYAHGNKKGDRPARWRMFSAELLVFLLYDQDTGTTDAALLDEFLAFFDTEDDLTAIDRLFLTVAKQDAPYPDAHPTGSSLIKQYEPRTRDDVTAAGGTFCPPSTAMFRRDLAAVLATELPKPDKVQWLTLLISLHLTTRMYRLAVVKGDELNAALAAASGVHRPGSTSTCPGHDAAHPSAATDTDPSDCLTRCSLAGAIKFRTGAGRFRPITRRDPCRDSYVELDQRKLLALPAVLVTTNLALRAWTALGGPPHESSNASALAEALSNNPELRNRHNAVCAALAAMVRANKETQAPTPHLKETAGLKNDLVNTAGLVALRDSVLRHRRTDLRHQSRDVVNQLMLDLNAAGGGSLVSRNGSHTFFEVDERLLLLLVRLTCPLPVPYDKFLRRLLAYGLAPQDTNERSALADTLERLGLLVRYSDAGEASFVHYR